jgi:multiple antibiotic resistance protein
MEEHLAAYILHIVTSTVLIFGALFPIVNPLGSSPIFLNLTRDYSSEARTLLSRKIALNSFFLLIASTLIGTHVLAFFGISLPVVQVGGGLLVVATGWAMLNRKDDPAGPTRAESRDLSLADLSTRAFYPLTMPLTVGPGAISVAITLGANVHRSFRGDFAGVFEALVGSALVGATVYLSYRFAEKLEKLLGETAMGVILRLSSFILVCIGVQIVWNGVSGLLKSANFVVRAA